MTDSGRCAVCESGMNPGPAEWMRRCPACGFFASDLWDEKRWERKSSALDEAHRFPAIRELRRNNARLVLDRLKSIRELDGASLCDIGCGYGWFLEVAAEYRVAVTGIEPEERIARKAAESGLDVVVGCFPDCIAPGRAFDILTFNDVLEHIPDPESAVRACASHLTRDGLLSIAIPSSAGIFYRIASALTRLGMRGPFDRLWQKSFHSPHVSYFNPQNLERLVSRNGFRLEHSSVLPTLELRGLWNRLMMDSTQSPLVAAPLWCALVATSPIIRALPADIIHQVYRRA